ncbi:hypothetical protein V1512DRAFT_255951 [Lipomyces arxii]|uniref:uncharacterized protein n=1 Tax=Lipomyces arxii TaxID=56418 RepID=UPI0034CDA715
MEWVPFARSVPGLATACFTPNPTAPTSSSSIPLRLSDRVFVFEQSTKSNPLWYRGYLLAYPSLNAKSSEPRVYAGIFPASAVTLKEAPEFNNVSCKTPPGLPSSLDSPVLEDNSLPILSEISATLREWCPNHIHTFFRSEAKSYHKLTSISQLVGNISELYKQLASDILTDAEKNDAVKTAVWGLIRGNKLLTGEVIVRNEATGKIETGRDTDLVYFFRQQQLMALSTHGSNKRTGHVKSQSSENADLLHLMVRIGEISGKWEKGMMIKMYLCNKAGPVSEAICATGENVHDEQALFIDLPTSVQNDELFIVAEIYETVFLTTQVTSAIDLDNRIVRKSYTIKARRGVALGMVDVGRVLREKTNFERDLIIRVLSSSADEATGGWGTLRKRLSTGQSDGIVRSPKMDRITVALRAFVSPSSQILKTTLTSLFGNVTKFPKPLFTTLSTVSRDEMYLTISKVNFFSPYKPGSLFYVSVTSNSELNLSDTESKGSTEWNSCIISKGEQIGETISLSPLGRNADVILSICTPSGQSIGSAIFSLWNDGVIANDDVRMLPVVSIDGTTIAQIELKSCLVSTELSADATLIGIIKWRRARSGSTDKLLHDLRQVTFADENEVVKLLKEILDSVFGIIAWKHGDAVFEDAGFSALAHVLTILSEKPNVRFMLDEYMNYHFNYPASLAPVLHALQRLLGNHSDPVKGPVVREVLRVGKYVIRFIVTSWEKSQAKDVISIEHGTYPKILRAVFHQLAEIVGYDATGLDLETMSTAIANQTLALQHYSGYLAEVKSLYTEEQILDMATEFMEASALGCKNDSKLSMHRLVLVQSYSKSWMFTSSKELRKQLASKTIYWVRPYLCPATEADLDGFTAFNAWREKIRLCSSILAQQFKLLWHEQKTDQETCALYVQLLPDVASTFISLQNESKRGSLHTTGNSKFKNEYSTLFPESYPFPHAKPVDTSVKKIPFDELSIELMLLVAVLSEFATYDNGSVTNNGELLSETKALTFLGNLLQVCNAALSGAAIPTSWISVYMFLHRSVMSCLEFISLILLEQFVPPDGQADDQLVAVWFMYFDTLSKLAGSPALEIENLTTQKRRAVWTIAGDIRESSALLLTKLWNKIGTNHDAESVGLNTGGFQTRFGTTKTCGDKAFVGGIVRLWVSRHEVLRAQAVNVLRSMIVSEWTVKHQLFDFQSDIIDALDEIFKTKGRADSFMKNEFISALYKKFPLTQEPLGVAVHTMLSTISRLLDLLLELHTLPDSDAYNDDRILCTLNLMQFLKDLHREDTFISYVQQLVYVQQYSGHYAEAGLTLGLHANMYDWSKTKLLPALAEPELPAQSAFERREALTLEMIKFFELGQSPELVLQHYKELASKYEQVSFDLVKLSKTSNMIAKLYQDELSASAATKAHPQYFQVVYQGLGFHKSLRGKQFIVQGSRWEKLAEFTDRLQNIYPDAKVVTTKSPLAQPTPEANRHFSSVSAMSLSSVSSIFENEVTTEGQFLQIVAVTPEPSSELAATTGLSANMRDFFLRCDMQLFSVLRPVRSDARSSNAADVWIEKTIFTTKEKFPAILRRSEIVSSETIRVSPVTNAAQLVTSKTSEILLAARRSAAARDEETYSAQLSMLVSGSVDAPVNGGVQQYRNLLGIYSGDLDPEMVKQCEALRAALLDYVVVLKYAMLVHSRVVSNSLRPLHDSLCALFERNFESELKIIEDEGRSVEGTQLVPGLAQKRQSEEFKSSLTLSPQQTATPSVGSSENSSMRRSNTFTSTHTRTQSATVISTPSIAHPNSPYTHAPSLSAHRLDHKRSISSISTAATFTMFRNKPDSLSMNTITQQQKTNGSSISSRMGSVTKRFGKMKLGGALSSSKTSLGIFREED